MVINAPDGAPRRAYAADAPVAGALAVQAPREEPAAAAATTAAARWEADHLLTGLYLGEYRSLVRLAALLVHDTPTAEDVVQETFIAMYLCWWRLRDTEKAPFYLRRAVLNRSRSVLRQRTLAVKNAIRYVADEPSAESGAIMALERSAVIAALRKLPERQCEAIVLRYYAGLSEAEIAVAMGVTKGCVKTHTARGMARLKSVLEQEISPGYPQKQPRDVLQHST
jgi:RNA polymerase sigma-70 factor (sigma-E family)